jgi:HPt (histidine-containing phosphotransfer) domain-containing protein
VINTEPGVRPEDGEQQKGGRPGWTLPEMLRELDLSEDGLVIELIEAFKTDTAARLERVRCAITQANLAVVSAEIHSIKGSARQIGADVMASTCQDIESQLLSRSISNLAEAVRELETDFVGVCLAMG